MPITRYNQDRNCETILQTCTRLYLCISRTERNEKKVTDGLPVPTLVKIERMCKLFKTHRCALDFDRGFIEAEVNVAEDEVL